MFRRKADEVQILEDTIRARSEQHKKAGVELDATCHICLKTKFADGVGHLCNYCSIRCCARCGGKVTLRSNKVNKFLAIKPSINVRDAQLNCFKRGIITIKKGCQKKFQKNCILTRRLHHFFC